MKCRVLGRFQCPPESGRDLDMCICPNEVLTLVRSEVHEIARVHRSGQRLDTIRSFGSAFEACEGV